MSPSQRFALAWHLRLERASLRRAAQLEARATRFDVDPIRAHRLRKLAAGYQRDARGDRLQIAAIREAASP